MAPSELVGGAGLSELSESTCIGLMVGENSREVGE